MVYRVIGVTSGKALEGLDIVFAEFQETAGKWSLTPKASECFPYTDEWLKKIRSAAELSAYDFQVLDSEYAQLVAQTVQLFIDKNQLQYQVMMISFHGHTIFHDPQKKISVQLGQCAILAALTGINVVGDFRATDIGLGGKGNPLAPIGEKLLFPDTPFLLNLGALATLAYRSNERYVLCDVAPCSKILNKLAEREGKRFDDNGSLAAAGETDLKTLDILNSLEYYQLPAPKTLAHDFAADVIYPLVKSAGKNTSDALRTAVEHIVFQIGRAVEQELAQSSVPADGAAQILITGGTVNNGFLLERLKQELEKVGVKPVIPDNVVVEYKESLIVALLGILRWREENNTQAVATGATRNSISGAIWMGLEA